MFPKIILPVLALAAFLYALWLVVFRLRLPDPQAAAGVRKRFYLATLLFVGFLTVVLTRSSGEVPPPACYAPPVQRAVSPQEGVLATLAAVWKTLDPKDGESFGKKLEAAVQQGQMQQQLSDLLKVAFRELAYHRERTRGKGRMVTCYDMSQLGVSLMESRESACKQLELLRNAKQAGKIDKETAEKCQAVLAKELEMLSQANQLRGPGAQGREEKLLDQYSKGALKPGEAATEAAAFIVRMETGRAAAAEKTE
jgi:hypothetical protein